MTLSFSTTLYGCRGSLPVGGTRFNRYGGATPCLVAHLGQRDIVIDAGSGILQYTRELMKRYAQDKTPIEAVMLFTHLHMDHLMGLPFFAPLFLPDASISLFGPRMGQFESFEASLNHFIRSPFFPVSLWEMQSRKNFVDLNEADVLYFVRGQAKPIRLCPSHPSDKPLLPHADSVEAEIHCLRGYNHPKSGVFFYKILASGRTLVFATDTEGYVHGDQRLLNFCQNADVLIHDAMYTNSKYTAMPMPTQGFGHSTVEIAATLAKKANVQKLILFHHDPASTDEDLDQAEALGRSIFPETEAAYDGMRIDLT